MDVFFFARIMAASLPLYIYFLRIDNNVEPFLMWHLLLRKWLRLSSHGLYFGVDRYFLEATEVELFAFAVRCHGNLCPLSLLAHKTFMRISVACFNKVFAIEFPLT
jgi:hypothetical protein